MLIDLISELERLDREAERKNNMKEKALHDCTTEELKSELERRGRERLKEEETIKIQEDIVKKDHENLGRVLSKYNNWYRLVNSNGYADPRDRVYYCHMLDGLGKALISMVASYKTSEYKLCYLKSRDRINLTPIINPVFVSMKIEQTNEDYITISFYYNGDIIYSAAIR